MCCILTDHLVYYGHYATDYDTEYLNCFCLKGFTVSQFIANVCLHVLITIIVHIMIIIIIVNASTIRQYSCIYHTCTIISCLINHDNLMLLSYKTNIFWSGQPSINDIVTSVNMSIAMSINYYTCITLNIFYYCATACMYPLLSPDIYTCIYNSMVNSIMNNYIHSKHYACSLSAFIDIQLIMKVILVLILYSSQQITIQCYRSIFIFSHYLLVLYSGIIHIVYARVVYYLTFTILILLHVYQYVFIMNDKIDWHKNTIMSANIICTQLLIRRSVGIYGYMHLLYNESKHLFYCIFFGNDLMVAKRYEQIFSKYPTCIIYLPILLIFLGLLIWQLETVYNIIMCTHRWISIPPEKWLV